MNIWIFTAFSAPNVISQSENNTLYFYEITKTIFKLSE